MNRRDFIKQSAAVAAGIAAGATVTLPVALSGFPGVMGVDVGTKDIAAFSVAWRDQAGEIVHLESLVTGGRYNFYHVAQKWGLTRAQVEALSVEEKIDMTAFEKALSIAEEFQKEMGISASEATQAFGLEEGALKPYLQNLIEASGRSPWGQMVQDRIEEALTQEEGGFMEALG